VVAVSLMTFDHQTDEHAFDALDTLTGIAPDLRGIAAAGYAHAAIAVLADLFGHGITTEIIRDLQRQLDHWRSRDDIGG
jgi:hypothetical protein